MRVRRARIMEKGERKKEKNGNKVPDLPPSLLFTLYSLLFACHTCHIPPPPVTCDFVTRPKRVDGL